MSHWDCTPLTNRGQDHTVRYRCLGTFFMYTELGRNSDAEHNCLSIILNLNERALLTSMVGQFEHCSALMCCVTVISCRGGGEKVDDHARIFWGFSVVLPGVLLIDLFALVIRRVINLCAELLWHASAFYLHTLWESVLLKNSISQWSFRACYIWHKSCTKS